MRARIPASVKVALTHNIVPSSGNGSPGQPLDQYAEWDARETIEAVSNALQLEHEVVPIEARGRALFDLADAGADFVFNLAEGWNGVSREAQVPAVCEYLEIPYVGSDPLCLATCLHKARTKEVLQHHGIPTPPFQVYRPHQRSSAGPLVFPLIVKPLHEGSGKGITTHCMVRDESGFYIQVEKIWGSYRQPALVERFLPGREFTVAILGNGIEATILPIVEILLDALPPGANPVYSYEAKWLWDVPEAPLPIFACPAELSASLSEAIRSIALKAFVVLECRDWCRVDLRLDDAAVPHVLEVNPLPGILPRPEQNSCFPKAARAAGLSYEQMILKVMEAATKRVVDGRDCL